jgi:hypothetical protein
MTVLRNLIATISASSTPDPLLLSLSTLANGFYVGIPLTGQQAVYLRGSGGAGGFSYSIITGALPSGCALNTVTGQITGTPSVQGLFTFTAQVQDNASNVYVRTFSMRVQSGLFPLAVNPTPAVRTVIYRYQVLMADATGSTAGISYTIVGGALPAGLAMPVSGVIAGTPTAAVGTYYFTVRGTKAGVTLDAPMSITVRQPMSAAFGATITLPQSLRQMTVGIPVDDVIAFVPTSDMGYPPYSWSIIAGALPAGLSMDSKGRITGTPASATDNAFAQPTFAITDRAGQTRNFTPSGINALSVNSTLRAAVRGTFKTAGTDGLPIDLDMWAGYFGDGSDGDIVLDGTNNYPTLYTKFGNAYTQLVPVYANSITFGSNVTLNTSGLPTFVRTKTDGSGATGVIVRAFGGAALNTAGGVGVSSAFFGTTGNGGGGGAGSLTNGTVGGDATPSGQFANRVGTAGNGGRGGVGSGGAAGIQGAAQTGAATVATTRFPLRMPFLPFSWGFGCFAGGLAGGGGGGGGGTGALAGSNGGGAGGPGGVIYWFSYEIVTDAVTSWIWNAGGGVGANGVASGGAGRGAGGGGGGASGGIIWVVCVFRTGPAVANAIRVSGGDGGTAGATGAGNAGVDGVGASSGFGFFYELSSNNTASIGIVPNAGRLGGIAQLAF